MLHPATDEVLERLWYAREDNRNLASVADLRVSLSGDDFDRAVWQLEKDGAIRTAPQVEMLASGEERARGIVRRHRLAEILFSEVLELTSGDAEASACEFEHMLTERVVDRVCTFLGHPPKCPHGKPIPRGECCQTFATRVEPLTTRLLDMPVGERGSVVFIAPKSASRLSRLATLGVVPGTEVRLLKRKPSVVLQCGQTTIAIEDDMAKEIWVRPV